MEDFKTIELGKTANIHKGLKAIVDAEDYDRAARKLFDKFKKLNFPQG